MSFEWQTDETAVWDDEPETPPEPKPDRPKRPFLALSVLLLLLAVGATAVYATLKLQQRVGESTDTTEEALLASVAVVNQAAADGDVDLFLSFLSGSDPDWAQAQETAVRSGTFFERDPFNLDLIATSDPVSPTVTLAPDLTASEVTMTQTFAIDVGNGLTETVTLTRTLVYRLGPNRWLLSPPKPEFWISPGFYHGRYLRIEYPARDAKIVQRMALDLDAKLQEMCSRFSQLACPDGMMVGMELTTNEVVSSRPLTVSQGGLNPNFLSVSSLPTPSIVGIPQTEVGYDALYRGYATQIITAVLNHLSDDCCVDDPFFQATRAAQLRTLGLQPWPVDPANFENAAAAPLSLSDVTRYWQETAISPAADWPVYAFIDFFTTQYSNLTATQLQLALLDDPTATFGTWLETAVKQPIDISDVERQWILYQYQRSAAASRPSPIPLPQQDVQLLCRVNGRLQLSHYDLASQQFTLNTILPQDKASFMVGLPGDQGVAIGMADIDPSTAQMFLWDGSELTELSWPRNGTAPDAIPLRYDPTGQYLLIGSDGQGFGVIDMVACQNEGDCGYLLTGGYLTWSADGSRTVFTLNENVSLNEGFRPALFGVGDKRGSVVGQEPFNGNGSSPFWFNNAQLGYVQIDSETGGQAIVVADTATGNLQTLLTTEELIAGLPDGERRQFVFMDAVFVNPLDPDELLIATTNSQDTSPASFLLSYNWRLDKLTVLHQIVGEPREIERGYRFGPNGRYWLITTFNDQNANYQLTVYDLITDKIQIYSLDEDPYFPAQWHHDWSSDGKWLLTTQQGTIRLINPEFGTVKLIIPDNQHCQTAVWVNGE